MRYETLTLARRKSPNPKPRPSNLVRKSQYDETLTLGLRLRRRDLSFYLRVTLWCDDNCIIKPTATRSRTVLTWHHASAIVGYGSTIYWAPVVTRCHHYPALLLYSMLRMKLTKPPSGDLENCHAIRHCHCLGVDVAIAGTLSGTTVDVLDGSTGRLGCTRDPVRTPTGLPLCSLSHSIRAIVGHAMPLAGASYLSHSHDAAEGSIFSGDERTGMRLGSRTGISFVMVPRDEDHWMVMNGTDWIRPRCFGLWATSPCRRLNVIRCARPNVACYRALMAQNSI
jgi:hypothetical protein